MRHQLPLRTANFLQKIIASDNTECQLFVDIATAQSSSLFYSMAIILREQVVYETINFITHVISKCSTYNSYCRLTNDVNIF